MSQRQYTYVLEKLTNTVDLLATHPGDARARLNAAYLTFHTLTPEDFPLEHQAKWAWVMAEMVKFGPLVSEFNGEVWRGAVDNTMRRIRKSTAANIAKVIYELYWAISANQRYL